MKKINSIFSVSGEMVEDNGEDSFYYNVLDENFIIAAFDGCGGSGSKKYNNYSDKTGAYVASRAVCGGVKYWFEESKNKTHLKSCIQKSLSVCKKYADDTSRILGSLGKEFPTTAAIIIGKLCRNTIKAQCFWAGDSRCYMLDSAGLHQLTADDLENQDAMSNLINDGVMTNVINASSVFEIHNKQMIFKDPCIFLTATDGCFGYLESPMKFEQLITDSLINAKSIHEWQIALNERMGAVAGDDYTLCVAVYGFNGFRKIQDNYVKRNKYVTDVYINSHDDDCVMWDVYKKEYSIYL